MIILCFQDLKSAEEYFQRKMEYVTAQIEKIQPILIEKHKMRQGEYLISSVGKSINILLINCGCSLEENNLVTK